MHDGTLDHPLESQRRLCVHLGPRRDDRGVFADKLTKALTQFFHVGRAGFQNLNGRGIVQQREQQMFDRDELMASRPRLDKRHMQADFKFLGNHASSDIW